MIATGIVPRGCIIACWPQHHDGNTWLGLQNQSFSVLDWVSDLLIGLVKYHNIWILEVGALDQFSRFGYFQRFHDYQNIGALVRITFIHDRFHRSLAAVEAVKYEHDSMDLTNMLSKAEMSRIEKLQTEL